MQPNQKVLERDRHQPESTMTWAQYRALLITDQRIANGRAAYQQNRALLGRVQDRFGVDPGVITGIWGLESSFGTGMGDFHVVEALATLAWEGRRASFFRGELLAALRILDHGDVAPARMLGSYAGAMGQPQFMPSSYLRYAVDFEGHGRRDIWTSKPDVLASIANYLAQSGWRGGEPWGQAVTLPANFDRTATGRDNRRPVGEWARLGRARGGRAAAGARRYSGRAAAAGWTRRRCVPGLCELRRDPPLQPVGLLRAGGRIARRHPRRVRLAFALLLALLAASCHRPPPANPHYVLGAPYQAGGVWYYPRESYEGQETGLATVYSSGHADADRRRRGVRPDGARRRAPDAAASRDRAPHQPGERPPGAGAHQRPRAGDAAPADRGDAPHRDAAALSGRRRGARAAGGAAGGKPRGGRCGAGRAEA